MPSLIGNKPNQVPSNGDLGTLAFQDGVVPAGSLVGTTATQTLTNKTINASQLVDASVTPEKLSTQSQYTGFKNRIINGAMMIDQRNAGASVSINADSIIYTVDRFFCAGENADGVFSAQQDTTAPAGFKNSLKLTVTTTDSSLGASQRYLFGQSIEGLNVADLGWGTASASPVTLSFWVRSSVTGTFSGSLANSNYNRCYPFSYTISAADTWEQKTVTISGDTTGTWLTTNGVGIRAWFTIGAGSSNLGTAGAWGSTYYFGATGTTNLMATSGATFYITGVQLEKGSTATSFDYRPYGTELALCQRYYEVIDGISAWGYNLAANAIGGPIKFAVTKRAAPTLTITTTPNYSNGSSLTLISSNINGCSFYFLVTATSAAAMGNSTPAQISAAIEL